MNKAEWKKRTDKILKKYPYFSWHIKDVFEIAEIAEDEKELSERLDAAWLELQEYMEVRNYEEGYQKPSKHGSFFDSACETIEFKEGHKLGAVIRMVQAGKEIWYGSVDVNLPNSGRFGAPSVFGIRRSSRDLLLLALIEDGKRFCESEHGSHYQSDIDAAKKVEAWLETLKQPRLF